MKIRTSEYFVREVIISMIRNRWMTFASIGTVTVSLFVLGVFMLLVVNLTRMASELESQVQIAVYLNDALTEEGRAEVEKMMRDMNSISKIEYIPREQAIKRLEERSAIYFRSTRRFKPSTKFLRGHCEEAGSSTVNGSSDS